MTSGSDTPRVHVGQNGTDDEYSQLAATKRAIDIFAEKIVHLTTPRKSHVVDLVFALMSTIIANSSIRLSSALSWVYSFSVF